MPPVKQFPSTGNPVNDRRAFINALLNGGITAKRIVNEYPIEYEEPEPIDYDMVAVNGVYISINETNPSITLGYGTWIRFANGRCLVGVDETDPTINAPSLEVGSKTSVSSGTINSQTFTGNSVGSNAITAGTPSGTVSQPTFTGNSFSSVINHTHAINVSESPHTHIQDPHTHIQNAHNHGLLEGQTDGAGSFMDRSNAASATTFVTDNATAVNQNATAVNQGATTGISATSANPAGGVSSITPSGTISQPTFAGSALGTHSHSTTATGTVSQATFTGAVQSIMQPSVTVYFWLRTA